MAKLEALKQGIGNLQKRLDSADSIKKSSLADVQAIMDGQFSQLSANIQRELTRLVNGNSQNQTAATTAAVQKAVFDATQTFTHVLNTLSKVQTDAEKGNKTLSGEIGNASSRKDVADLSKQVLALGLQIDSLPKEFPLPKDIDLSGLSNGVSNLQSSIDGIKIPDMPKTIDVRPQLKEMEDRMGKRVVEFDVQRDTVSGLIDRIVVTEGNV